MMLDFHGTVLRPATAQGYLPKLMYMRNKQQIPKSVQDMLDEAINTKIPGVLA